MLSECLRALRRYTNIKAIIKINKLAPTETPTPVPIAAAFVCEPDVAAAMEFSGVGTGLEGDVGANMLEVTSVVGAATEPPVGNGPPLQYPAFGSFERSSSVK
jgi:hypothetical protein